VRRTRGGDRAASRRTRPELRQRGLVPSELSSRGFHPPPSPHPHRLAYFADNDIFVPNDSIGGSAGQRSGARWLIQDLQPRRHVVRDSAFAASPAGRR
jgi:hypothetical protein